LAVERKVTSRETVQEEEAIQDPEADQGTRTDTRREREERGAHHQEVEGGRTAEAEIEVEGTEARVIVEIKALNDLNEVKENKKV